MYIPDGSELDYDTRRNLTPEELKDPLKIPDDFTSCDKIAGRYSFGWLGDNVPDSNKGWEDKKLKQKVLDLLNSDLDKFVIMQHCGWHDCEICQKEGKDNNEDNCKWNGSYVINYNEKEYRCPESVKHYIEEHDYNPGEEVIEALFNGKWELFEERQKHLEKQRDEHFKKLKKEEAEKEKLRLSKMTKKQIEAEKISKIKHKQFLEYASQKVKQLRESGAIIE